MKNDNFNIEVEDKEIKMNENGIKFSLKGLKVDHNNRGTSKSGKEIWSHKTNIDVEELAVGVSCNGNINDLIGLIIDIKTNGLSAILNKDVCRAIEDIHMKINGRNISAESLDFGYNSYDLTHDVPETSKRDNCSKVEIDELEIDGNLETVVNLIKSIENAENEKDPNKETDIDQFVEELKKKNPAMSKEELVGAVISAGYDRKTAEAIL